MTERTSECWVRGKEIKIKDEKDGEIEVTWMF